MIYKTILILACSLSLRAATYYVDYTNGLDANNGTAKTTPWKNAPGMNGCASTCSSTTINPGDSIILKGCVTWPNAALPWNWNVNGSSGSQIYIGVDQTWWDTTVSGCSSAWNRPILNSQGLTTNRSTGREDIVTLWKQYTTFDNIEITGALGNPTNNATDIIDLLGGSGQAGSEGVIISNVYIHGWVNPYVCFGTGNVAANSATITNFVPTYCTSGFGSAWLSPGPLLIQVFPQGSYWPVQSNGPTVTSISGSNPYTIVTNSSTVASACTGCYVLAAQDNENIISANETGNAGAVIENSVIDGSDVAQVASLNPYGDCGLSESNNNLCVGSGNAGWRGPQIWLNNVIQYVASAYVGPDGYFGGNLIRYLRTPINPTAHSNIWEAVGADALDANGNTMNWLFWNNLVIHTNNPNSSTPGGRITVGLSIEPAANTSTQTGNGLPSYTFNNVISDTITNATFEPVGCSTCGVANLFNNTMDCGPSWSLSYQCTDTIAQGGVSQGNNYITTASPALTSSFTSSHDIIWTPTTATSAGYTTSETYIYSPPNNNCTGVTPCTIGGGTSAASLCSAVSAIYALAGSACLSDTIYGATYDVTNHTAVTGARSALARSGTLESGAYQFATSSNPPHICYNCVNNGVIR